MEVSVTHPRSLNITLSRSHPTPGESLRILRLHSSLRLRGRRLADKRQLGLCQVADWRSGPRDVIGRFFDRARNGARRQRHWRPPQPLRVLTECGQGRVVLSVSVRAETRAPTRATFTSTTWRRGLVILYFRSKMTGLEGRVRHLHAAQKTRRSGAFGAPSPHAA